MRRHSLDWFYKMCPIGRSGVRLWPELYELDDLAALNCEERDRPSPLDPVGYFYFADDFRAFRYKTVQLEAPNPMRFVLAVHTSKACRLPECARSIEATQARTVHEEPPRRR